MEQSYSLQPTAPVQLYGQRAPAFYPLNRPSGKHIQSDPRMAWQSLCIARYFARYGTAGIPRLRRLRQEDHELKASLDCTVSPCLNNEVLQEKGWAEIHHYRQRREASINNWKIFSDKKKSGFLIFNVGSWVCRHDDGIGLLATSQKLDDGPVVEAFCDRVITWPRRSPSCSFIITISYGN